MNLFGKLLGSIVTRWFEPANPRPVARVGIRNRSAWGLSADAAITGAAGDRPAPGVVPSGRRRLRVMRVVDETPDTRSWWLQSQTGEALTWRAGQFLTGCFPLPGGEARRAYSVSNVPGGEALRITVKRLSEGHVSNWMREHLQVGQSLEVLGPSGDFVLPEAAVPRAVFVAAGSGITPIRALIEALLQRAPETEVHLLYASHSPRQIIFRDELLQLQQHYPRFTITWCVSRPGRGWTGLRGRLTPEALLADLQPYLTEARCYVCGPEGFLQMSLETLRGAGVPDERLQSERFLAAATAVQPRPNQPQRITFARSGREVLAAPGQTVLDAGLQAGVALEYSCQVGGCGHCRVRVIDGDVAMDEPNCLSEAEKAQGYRLACLSYASRPLTVDA